MNPVNLATARRTFCIAGGRSPTLKRNASFVLSDRMITATGTTVMLAQHRSHVEVYHFATGLEAKRQPQALA
jgi:hypothetical protein